MAKKKITVPVVVTTEEPDSLWTKIKKFFYRSESVFLAWVTAITGIVTSTVSGVLASSDFSSILAMFKNGMSFTKEQVMVMGAGALGLGVIQYVARVRGTKEVDGKLLPKAS